MFIRLARFVNIFEKNFSKQIVTFTDFYIIIDQFSLFTLHIFIKNSGISSDSDSDTSKLSESIA